MKGYKPRLIDNELERALEAFGAVLITGPKWCGKTTTAEQFAKSAMYMQDPDKAEEYGQAMKVKPSLLLEGEKPRLIDEWQTAPRLWDAIRHSVDRASGEGMYILTGSATMDESQIAHSGAGRITRVRMSTMSLFESGDSTGEASLGRMFAGGPIEGRSHLGVEDLADLLVRGGWPKAVGRKPAVAMGQVRGYCNSIVESEVKTDGIDRDSRRMRLLLRSLSRSTSAPVSDASIAADMAEKEGAQIHINTLRSYLKALERICVTDDLPAWAPKLRSKAAARMADVRHMADPSIAACFLGASPKSLLSDMRTFGLLFESMVVRDLRAYAQSLGGEVRHYRDSDGLEADAVVCLHDGRWGAVEAKLGAGMIDEAAGNLLKLKGKVEADSVGSPSFLAVVTGTEHAYVREDGVMVVPLGCMRD